MNPDSSRCKSSAEEEEVPEEPIPIVFQCARCANIITDSMVFISRNENMNSLSFTGVSNKVNVLAKVEVSSNGYDEGSTFRPVACGECEQVIGRKYLATPPALDVLRDGFTLHIAALTSYEVGKNLHYATGKKPMPESISNQYLFAQLCKLQSLMITHSNRLKSLEEKLRLKVPIKDNTEDNASITGDEDEVDEIDEESYDEDDDEEKLLHREPPEERPPLMGDHVSMSPFPFDSQIIPPTRPHSGTESDVTDRKQEHVTDRKQEQAMRWSSSTSFTKVSSRMSRSPQHPAKKRKVKHETDTESSKRYRR